MKYLVIKCGGSVMENLPQSFFENIIDLYKSGKYKPLIIHGGGPLISSLLKKLGIETQFINGLRVTTDQVLDVVEMVLSGSVNKQLVRKLIQCGGKAYGISGVDGMLLKAEQKKESMVGFVGEVVKVNTSIIEDIFTQGFIPIISPVGIDEHGQRYNINGDTASSAVAKALGASLCMISDIPGIYKVENGEKVTLKQVEKAEIEQFIHQGIISGGMIPKVKAALDGLVHQVPEVVILNGMEKDCLKKFVKGEVIGTKISLGKESLHVC